MSTTPRHVLYCLLVSTLILSSEVGAEVVELGEAPAPELEGDPLAMAQSAYSEIDFEGTLRYAQSALQQGGCGPRQMARIYELIGMAAAAIEQEDLSRDAYTRLLALNSEFQLDEGLSPRFRGPYLEARGYWAAHSDRLQAQVIFARSRGALRIDSTDPLEMGQTLRVLSRLEGELEFNEFREPISPQTYIEVPGSVESPRVEYVVQILDVHGNRLFEIGNEDAPEVAGRPIGGSNIDDEPRSRAWLWAVIGVAAAVVVAGAVATGVVLGVQSGEVGMQTTVDLGLTD